MPGTGGGGENSRRSERPARRDCHDSFVAGTRLSIGDRGRQVGCLQPIDSDGAGLFALSGMGKSPSTTPTPAHLGRL
jgi:hypothetical protein